MLSAMAFLETCAVRYDLLHSLEHVYWFSMAANFLHATIFSHMRKKAVMPGMEGRAFDPGSLEAEAGGSL